MNVNFKLLFDEISISLVYSKVELYKIEVIFKMCFSQ